MAFALAIAGSAALFGCAASAAATAVPAAAVSGLMVDDDAIRDLNERHRHHPQGGVAMLIALSLDTLGLSPGDEAVVAKIQSDLFAAMEPARVGVQGVLNALADGMAAGAIDEARIGAAIAEVERASTPVREATVDALRRLHAVLAPPQRAALVDKIVAHWAISRHANAEDGQGGRDGHLADLAGELGLSADQVARIGVSFQAAMRAAPGAVDPAEIDAQIARLDAFRGYAFDAGTVSSGPAGSARLAARGATRLARFYQAVDPVLTPEQRAKLVISLREHAGHQDVAVAAAP